MLSYVNHGARRYDRNPILPYHRPGWEFQAVLRGSISLVLPEGPGPLRSRRLWLFPPDCAHGWAGNPGKEAEIVVFHFLSVPEPIRAHAEQRRFLDLPINVDDCRRLRLLARRAIDYWHHPSPTMVICGEHALMELSLLVCEKKPAQPAGRRRVERAVNEALHWFAKRLRENPTLEEVSQAVGVSAPHLRRFFYETLQAPPKPIFDQLRFQRALQLMADPQMKLEEVGLACGFGSASAFSRAFKTKFGCSPESWRS